ncbi:MAG TPA: HAMP domain-containing sensor histidine kinase, partial [Albitalea sp.]|nr:HAMP domain-containing sensor histidine kinase [Albitalea sp.]
DLIQSFKRVAVDQSSEERRRFKVRQYVEDVLLSLEPKVKRSKARVQLTCDEALEADSYPGAFAQIITNLLVNALVHGFGNDREGLVCIAIDSVGSDLAIEFSDNGAGIPAAVIGKIFDPFFTTKRGHGGSGLGLHLVFNLVTQTLRGTIQCESREGHGATFRVTIPRCP